MPVLQIKQYFSVVIDGIERHFGSDVRPASIVVSGEIIDKVHSIAVSTSKILWGADTEGMGIFKFFAVACDFDVMVEYVVDIGAQVGTGYSTRTCKGSQVANELGPAIILTSDVAYASDYASNFSAGTLDTIERIRVKNLSATQVAKVAIWGCK